MPRTIVNITLPLITREIENILTTYAYHPYQQAFAIPDLRQKLIAYVLSRVPSRYTVVEEGQQLPVTYNSSEQYSDLRTLIHRGIQQILQIHGEWAAHHMPQAAAPGYAPSNWFG